MRLLFLLFRPVYYLLYHQLAWTYDFVASIVSLGHWQDWVHSALPYLNGRVLEIGFGPGHLQQFMYGNNLLVFGLDESPQMARQASRRLRKQGAISRLSRGYAQYIPFPGGAFDSVVSTFPSDYIFDPLTLKEIKRVLTPTGRLIILPMAWITGKHPLERLAAGLVRVSGETPGKPWSLSSTLRDRFSPLGFDVHSEIVELKASQVLVIVVEKRKGS